MVRYATTFWPYGVHNKNQFLRLTDAVDTAALNAAAAGNFSGLRLEDVAVGTRRGEPLFVRAWGSVLEALDAAEPLRHDGELMQRLTSTPEGQPTARALRRFSASRSTWLARAVFVPDGFPKPLSVTMDQERIGQVVAGAARGDLERADDDDDVADTSFADGGRCARPGFVAGLAARRARVAHPALARLAADDRPELEDHRRARSVGRSRSSARAAREGLRRAARAKASRRLLFDACLDVFGDPDVAAGHALRLAAAEAAWPRPSSGGRAAAGASMSRRFRFGAPSLDPACAAVLQSARAARRQVSRTLDAAAFKVPEDSTSPFLVEGLARRRWQVASPSLTHLAVDRWTRARRAERSARSSRAARHRLWTAWRRGPGDDAFSDDDSPPDLPPPPAYDDDSRAGDDDAPAGDDDAPADADDGAPGGSASATPFVQAAEVEKASSGVRMPAPSAHPCPRGCPRCFTNRGAANNHARYCKFVKAQPTPPSPGCG